MKHIRYTDIGHQHIGNISKCFWNNYSDSVVIRMPYLDLNQLIWEN